MDENELIKKLKLDESFSDARFDLEVYYDLEISNCVRLDLTILVHPDRFLLLSVKN